MVTRKTRLDHRDVVNKKLVIIETRFRNPINALCIPLQDSILDHVTSDGGGVVVIFGDDRIEFSLGVFAGGGELSGDAMEDSDLLGRFDGDGNQGTVGIEELVDLFGHRLDIKLFLSLNHR